MAVSGLRALAVVVAVGAVLLVGCAAYASHYMLPFSFRLAPDPTARIVLLGDPQIEGIHRVWRQGFYGWMSMVVDDMVFRNVINNVVRYVRPTHIVTMGDLFSYQFCNDDEFYRRVARYNWIFGHDQIVSRQVQLINLTGNHDIGYGYEVKPDIVARFERAFGPVNAKFSVAGHLVAVVNSMTLDASRSEELRQASWQMLRDAAREARERSLPLILLTHIPLYKPPGSCMEDPFITYDGEFVKEQSQLSEPTSRFIVDEVQPRWIFTGHDHNGCFYEHSNVTTEYTVRSMMGSFGGHTAVFDVFNNDAAGDVKRYKLYQTEFFRTAAITGFLVSIGVWIVLALVLFLWSSLRVGKTLYSFLRAPPHVHVE